MLKKFTPESLVFPIGEETYTIPPVDYDTGIQLAAVLSQDPTKPQPKKQRTSTELFRMVMGKSPIGVDNWDRMRADGVPFPEMFRAGMACLAHFQVLLADPNPATANPAAMAAAAAVWESGVRPEDVAAAMAANQKTTSTSTPTRSTRPAAATTTPRRASSTGTRKNPKTTRSTSRGSRSKTSGR